MPLSRRVARWNRAGLNRVTRPFVTRLPGFGLVVHRGRRSGREFRTPVNVFTRPGGYLFALTYGRDSDWVRNVLAAGTATLITRGRTVTIHDPVLLHDPARSGVPALPRAILGRLDVSDFLQVVAER